MKKHSILLSLLILTLSVSVYSQKEEARKTVLKLVEEKKIPGLSVAVMKNNKIVWSEGFGYSDLEQNIKVSRQTKFRIGSISKLFTSAAIAKLYEKNLIKLDDSIYKYVPTFPKKKNDITIRQLAGHLGGIKHYGRSEYVNNKRYTNVSESLKIFQNAPLKNVPGDKYSYSSYGYTLLSSVIEGASQKDFLTYLQDEVFSPLKLNSTLSDDNLKVIKSRTRFYSLTQGGKWVNAIYTDNSDRWASGGFLSTSEDLVRFASAHLENGFVKNKTRKILFTSQKISDSKETGVGIGWRIGKDENGRVIYHHGGASIGGRAVLLIYPEQKTAIAVLSNLTFARFSNKEVLKIVEPFVRK